GRGAPALRRALATTRRFAEVLFRREVEAEPLDTPERKAGLKGRLRQAANAVQDKDLAEQYRRDLFDRFDALFPRQPRPQPQSGRPGPGGRRRGPPPLQAETAAGGRAMAALARSVYAT